MSEKPRAADIGSTRVLEPVGEFDHRGMPTSYRVRRVAEPAPKQPSRLLYLPPVWTRASFWLPVGTFLTPPQSAETRRPDPRDDFAA